MALVFSPGRRGRSHTLTQYISDTVQTLSQNVAGQGVGRLV